MTGGGGHGSTPQPRGPSRRPTAPPLPCLFPQPLPLPFTRRTANWHSAQGGTALLQRFALEVGTLPALHIILLTDPALLLASDLEGELPTVAGAGVVDGVVDEVVPGFPAATGNQRRAGGTAVVADHLPLPVALPSSPCLRAAGLESMPDTLRTAGALGAICNSLGPGDGLSPMPSI